MPPARGFGTERGVCHPEKAMQASPVSSAEPRLLLAIDTCGPSGSVALGRMAGDELKIVGMTELAGRSYSATLVTAVSDLLRSASARLAQLEAIVVTSGPGSFTGVRVGLSAVKGLAEPAGVPVVSVSRLEVLARKAGTEWAALDAHRHEAFLRLGGGVPREMLAGTEELAALNPPGSIAVCDEAAEALLRTVWPEAMLTKSDPPTAADALAMALPRIVAREFDDLALLDGHYLRRSDAEIFGPKA